MAKKSVIYRTLFVLCIHCSFLCSFNQVFTILCVFTVIIEQNVPDKESELSLGVLFFIMQEKNPVLE